MLLSERHKFIFIHIPKTAGTSITHALSPFAMDRKWHYFPQRIIKKLHLPSPFYNYQPFNSHITSSEIIEKIGDKSFRSYFSFAFIRNPWEWQVSLYKYILKSKEHRLHKTLKKLGSFEAYIKWRCKECVKLQKDYICSKENEILVDFVGRYENLDEDFNKICEDLNIKVSLPVLNVSNTKPYRDHYNKETEEIVREAFKEDIDFFGYEF